MQMVVTSVRREANVPGELCGEEHQFFGANSYAPGTNAFNALIKKWRELEAARFFARSVLHSNRLVGEPD